MPDFTLVPDEPLDPPETPARHVRLVSTGLAPTADLPRPGRRTLDLPPCHAPCATCGALVLVGATQSGTRLALDVGIRTYTVLWLNGTPEPVLHDSRGYPVHRCPRWEGTP